VSPMNNLEKEVKKYKSSRKTSGLVELALKLYRAGFNVIPVDSEKKPLCSWSPRERIEESKLKELLAKASGIAICGGPENPFKDAKSILVIFDIDNPSILEKSVFLKSLVEHTVSWKTGPRCPQCSNKHLEVLDYGRRFKCNKCNIEFTIENAPRGIGALAYVDLDVYEKYLKSTIRAGPVEILVNNYQLIPPSIHPTGVRYEWIKQFNFEDLNYGVYPLTEGEFKNILLELANLTNNPSLKRLVEEEVEEVVTEKVVESKQVVESKAATTPMKLRELQDSEILRIKELLLEAYRPGNRQYIWLFLSGWVAKARISPVSIAKVLKMLYEETGDQDSIKTRAAAIVYSYKKAGIDIDKYSKELEGILGVAPYGLEKTIQEEEVKGKTGLQEVLEAVVGEERALDIIRELEEIFKTSSPFRDSVMYKLDYAKNLFAIANLRKLRVFRAVLNGNRLEYREVVFEGAPVEVIVHVDPLGGVTKYQVKWETEVRPRPLVIGPAEVEDILDRLAAEGLVVNNRYSKDVLNAIINAYLRKGRAIIKYEIEYPGFYLDNGRVIAVKYDIKDVTREELREALLLLNELASEWYKHSINKFADVIRWGIIAPFGYVYKQKGKWIKWLYLTGVAKTGKTTLGQIVLHMWNLGPKYERGGGEIDTPAKVGRLFSMSTFPFLINEPQNALEREDVVELLKHSIEGLIIRGRHEKGSYREFPALATAIFTSNKYLPEDDALLRRFKVLVFTFGERIEKTRAREFEEKVKPRLKQLGAIGYWVAKYVLENGIGEAPEKFSIELLEKMYREAGLEPPEWIYLSHEEEIDVYEELRELIRSFLVMRINEEYSRFVGRITVEREDGVTIYSRSELGFNERVKIVLEKHLIPWLMLKENQVVITTSILSELEDNIPIAGGLKSLAELLGSEWVYNRNIRVGKWVGQGIVVDIDKFIEFLSPT